jgi:hypothetical protein
VSTFAPALATLVVAVAIDVLCLADLARATEVRSLPRPAWAAVIVLATPLGAVLYVLLGRTR